MCFLPGNRLPAHTAGDSLLGSIQDQLKRYGRLYYILLHIFAPILAGRKLKTILGRELGRHDAQSVILNLGSGPQTLHQRQDVINVDLFAFDSVDMVADATDLPVEDQSVDLLINMALLEHVPQPQAVVQEMFRVLKTNGKAVCYLPFLVPFHAAPHDYHRWTLPGTRELFKDFGHVEAGVGAGPTSCLLYVFQEWTALAMSLGSRKLHDLIFLLLMLLTAPVKLLDLVLVHHPMAEQIASGFYVLAEKGEGMNRYDDLKE